MHATIRTTVRSSRRRRLLGMAASAATVALLAGCSGSATSVADPAAPRTPAGSSAGFSGGSSGGQDPSSPAPDATGSAVPGVLRAAVSQPVEDPYYPDTSNPEVDVLHYALDLTYAKPTLTGTATVTFRVAKATGSVRLDLSDALEVSAVSLDGHDAAYTQQHDGLVTQTPGLRLDSVHELQIVYAGTPQAAPAPSARGDMTEGIGWSTDTDGSVYTFQEPYGAFTWYPCNDHPSDEAFYDATVTTDSPDVGVSNGTLESTTEKDGHTTTRWHLDQPVATYLTTLAIGPFREYHAQASSGQRLSYWLMPRDQHLLATLRRESVSAYDWLVQHAGPFPFSSLGIVVVGGQSAMETQTMMTLSRGVFARPDAVVEHEMAHQWFGDSVSPVDWQALWLNEGWAMYMQQWYESDTGAYEYGGGISRWRSYDNGSRRVSGPPGDYDPQHFGDVNVYLGPAMMLDAIRERIGDQRFGTLVKAWAADHAGENVDRADFTSWVNDVTGQDLTPLVDRWLDSRTTPR